MNSKFILSILIIVVIAFPFSLISYLISNVITKLHSLWISTDDIFDVNEVLSI